MLRVADVSIALVTAAEASSRGADMLLKLVAAVHVWVAGVSIALITVSRAVLLYSLKYPEECNNNS